MKTRLTLITAVILLVIIPSQVIAAGSQGITIPTFTIVAVDEDDSVTISAVNFPPNDTFTVRMGAYGTMGIGGYVVGTQNSGTGSFTATYTIPSQMVGATKIAIRLQSPSSGYYSYNWFWNNDHPDPTPAPGTTPSPGTTPAAPSPGLPLGGPGTIPSTTITSVTPDTEVTANGSNFPTNDTLNVYIGYFGTKGVGGVLVNTQTTSGSGTFTGTYSIPVALQGQSLLAIRWVSTATGYYAYDWFANTPGGTGPSGTSPGYPPNGQATHPLTNVTAVVQGTSVTIHGTNFSTNDSYTVRIGAYGTKGVGGIVVGTQNTDSTGVFTATYTIPASLAGSAKLAIRFESAALGYYCYDWFNNTTSP
jgi:hypothetical protein